MELSVRVGKEEIVELSGFKTASESLTITSVFLMVDDFYFFVIVGNLFSDGPSVVC